MNLIVVRFDQSLEIQIIILFQLGAMAALKSIFKEVEVPEPIDFFATKWGKEEFSQMSYSYVKIGASGSDYDVMAEPHTDRVLFAGEATNRHFPQTGNFGDQR